MRFVKNNSSFFYLGLITLIYFRFGNGYYLEGDGIGFFSYLPSLIIHQSLDFSKTMIACSSFGIHSVTPMGLMTNFWNCGTSILWLPFFIVGLFFLPLWSIPLEPICTYPMFYFTNSATFFYCLLTVFIAFDILKKLQFSSRYSSSVVLSSIFGTTFFFYGTYGASMAHGAGAFTVALFIWLCLSYEDIQSKQVYWLLLGLSCGLLMVVRSKNILYAPLMLIPLKATYRSLKTSDSKRSVFMYLLLFGLGCLVLSSSQFLIWEKMNGSLFSPSNIKNLNFTQFSHAKILFSSFHGHLFWNPIILLAMLGYLAAIKLKDKFAVSLIGFGFFMQFILNGFIDCWWNSYSFGIRHSTETFVPIVVGLACPLAVIRNRNVKGFIVLSYVVSAFWTIGLFVNYDAGRLNLAQFYTGQELLRLQLNLFENPFFFFSTIIKFPPIIWKACIILIFGTGLFFLVIKILKMIYPQLLYPLMAASLFLLASTYLALTINGAAKTQSALLSPQQMELTIMSDDHIRYKMFLDRLTEVQYLIRIRKNEKAKELAKKTIETYSNTKVWRIFEMENKQKISPSLLLDEILQQSAL